MYYIPRPYVCKKCSNEIQWSPSDPIATPLVVPVLDGPSAPVCPRCWNDWLLAQFGAMERKP